jgi:nucleoside-diphosphate-sugar epimerase
MKEPVETMLANITGLQVMLNLGKEKDVEKLLYISSSEVYGENKGTDSFQENDFGFVDILSERAPYPSSNRAGETLCVAYGMEYGLDTVIVRPGHIYGPTILPHDNRASAEFSRLAASGDDIVMKSKGTQKRSYCHTFDCASALLSVLLNGEKNNAYNISNPNSICTISEMAEMMAKAGNVNLTYQEATESEKKSFNTMTNSSLDSTKLESLGWQGVFDLESGCASTVETLKSM